MKLMRVLAICLAMIYANVGVAQELLAFGRNYSIILIDKDTVGFYGEFEEKSAFKLVEALAVTDAKYLDIGSPGGLMSEALLIGDYLGKNGITVKIRKESTCISACAFAVLKAKTIQLDGTIKFHSPYIPFVPTEMPLYEMLKTSDRYTLKLAKLFVSAGYTISFVELINDKTTRSTFMVFDDIENLYKFKNTGEDLLPKDFETLYTVEEKQ